MNRVNLLMCFFSLCLLASCSDSADLKSAETGTGTTVAVTQEIQVGLLPMQEVTTADTRADFKFPESAKPKGEDKTGLRVSGSQIHQEKRKSLHVSYGKNAMTRIQGDSDDMTTGEMTLKNAYIVQFNGTASTSTAAYVSGDVKSQLSSGTAITCNFVMTAGVKNRVYVVANVATAPTKGMTLATFEAPVTYTVSSSLPTIGGTQCLPMSAMQDVSAGGAFEPFRVKSLLAKLQLTCTGTLTLKGIPSGYSFYRQPAGDAAVRPSGVTYSGTLVLTSGATYYVPENLSGRVNLSVPMLRCAAYAPTNAMYMTIGANSTTYNIYPGSGSSQDFNVAGNEAYYITPSLLGTDNTYDWRVGTPPAVTALDGAGMANCYIATGTNTWYSFNGTVMGNGATTPVPADLNAKSVAAPIIPKPLSPVAADVLWETWNTTSTPTVGSVASAVYVAKDQLLFRTGASEGNAVIAARDGQNNIVWSWHIWRMNSTPASQPLAAITGFAAEGELQIMDRNLGALSAAVGNDLSTGLHYQWGRKDPMPAFAGLATTATVMVTQPAGIPVIPNSTAQYTVEQSIQQPATFFKYSGDWTSRNDNLWGTPLTVISGSYTTNKGSKSIYDPCPPGWRVPPGYTFDKARISSTTPNGTWNVAAGGFSFNLLSSGSSWFPASGYRNDNNGTLYFVGSNGDYRTATPNAGSPTRGSLLSFNSSSVYPADSSNRALGYSCRCVKE